MLTILLEGSFLGAPYFGHLHVLASPKLSNANIVSQPSLHQLCAFSVKRVLSLDEPVCNLQTNSVMVTRSNWLSFIQPVLVSLLKSRKIWNGGNLAKSTVSPL